MFCFISTDYFYFHLNEAEGGEKLIEPGIAAWDYCRLVYLVGAAYEVGYIGREEAWYEIINAAQLMQKSYNSWEAMAQSYAQGRYYWGGEEPFYQCKRINQALLYADPDSPWRKLRWDFPLKGKVYSIKDVELKVGQCEKLILPDMVEAVVDLNGGKLYRVKNDGSNLSKIVDMPISGVNIEKDWIYFTDAKMDQNGGVLYKAKKDGTEMTKVYRGTCRSVNVAGLWIYFQEAENYSGYYRIKVDGTCREEF